MNADVGQREKHLKTCVAGFRADFNLAPVLLHNSQGSVESEPCTPLCSQLLGVTS